MQDFRMMYASGFFPLVSAVQRNSAAVAAALGQVGQTGQAGSLCRDGDVDVDGDSDDNDADDDIGSKRRNGACDVNEMLMFYENGTDRFRTPYVALKCHDLNHRAKIESSPALG